MNPRASRCSRALQRQIITSKDALWITDALLAHAFESYCRVSRAWNRRASYVPGPLESQRRLGRRRIGDLNALQYPPTPPPWEFAIPLDLSKWKWQPPSSTAVAEQETQSDGEETHAPQGWLFQAMSVAFTRHLAKQLPSPSFVVASKVMTLIRADLDALRNLDVNTPDSTKFGHAKVITTNIRTLLGLGEISHHEVLPLFTEVLDTFESEFSSSPHLYEILGTAIWDILSGISNSTTSAPTLLDTKFWQSLLGRMSRLPADSMLGDLLVHAMEIIPDVQHTQISAGILSVLKNVFEAWRSSQSRVDADLVSWALDATFGTNTGDSVSLSIAEALCKFGKEEQLRLLDAAEDVVIDLERQGASETLQTAGRCELRYKWLSVIAHSPWARQEFLFSKALRLSDASLQLPPLTGSELSALMLAHWESRGYLYSLKKMVRFYKKHYKRHPDDANAITSMLLAFDRGNYPQNSPMGNLVSFWRLMAVLDRTNDVLASLEVYTDTSMLPKRFLEVLAFSSRNHYVALAIRELYTFKVRQVGEEDFDPGVFFYYLNDILMDPSLPFDTLPRAIGTDFLLPDKAQHAIPPMVPDRLWHKRAMILERTALALTTLDLSHLTDRQIWRRLEHCVNFFSQTRGQVPIKIIEVVYQFATKDLHEGMPGRTERLVWLVYLIRRACGPRVASACQRLFKRWRRDLLRVNPSAKLHTIKHGEMQRNPDDLELQQENMEEDLDPRSELEKPESDNEKNHACLNFLIEELGTGKDKSAPKISTVESAGKKKDWVYDDVDPEWEAENIPELFRLKRVEKEKDSEG